MSVGQAAPRPLSEMTDRDLLELIRGELRSLTLPARPKTSTMTVKETADEIKQSTKTVRNLVKSGRLKAAKLKPGGSSRILILRASVEQLLKESEL